MVEVTSGSSHGVSVSGSNDGTRRSFDLNSWQGLTEVLQAARKALNGDAYASFRDIVLQYAQSGGDAELKEKIMKIAASFGARQAAGSNQVNSEGDREASSEQKSKKKERMQALLQASADAFGTARRPAPKFTVSQSTPASPKPEESKPSENKVKDDTLRREPISSEHSFIPKNLPTQQEPPKTIDREASKPQPQKEPVPEAVKEPPPAPAETKREAPSAVPSAPPVAPAPNVPKKTVSELQASAEKIETHKARIAEIKHEVNTKIGNPVSLIDNSNDTGRQYMNALLDAMKAMSGGHAGSLDIAMAKLEKAYELMLEAVKEGAFKGSTGTPEKESGRTEPVPKAIPKAVETQELPKKPTAEEKKEAPFAAQTPAAERMQTPTSLQDQTSHAHTTPASKIPSLADLNAPGNRTKAEVQAETPKEPLIHAIQKNAVQAPEKQALPKAKVRTMPASTARDLHASEAARQSAMQLASKEPIAAHSPNQEAISAPEVTKALNQLLDEWTLFKGSGLFRIGSGGAQSALYKKLKDLSMFAVLAGRWEKASPEVTQTIKDYVNAWRHEQGVTYNPSETFEHYLRRVVLRILERQKQ